jgi:hypothetical protein
MKKGDILGHEFMGIGECSWWQVCRILVASRQYA